MEDLNLEIKESDKRTLGRLALEFGDDFLNSKHREIGLYGTDEKILSFLKNAIGEYLNENGEDVFIKFGRNGAYNIDVGFFLHTGYFRGINKDINIHSQ